MHCLEVIAVRNEKAAGREYAHVVNDGTAVQDMVLPAPYTPEWDAFWRGYDEGRKEG
jgi:hypothetical protein